RDNCRLGHARSHSAKLELINLDEWDENETYDQDAPTCLHYSIKWIVTLNDKLIFKHAESDLMLAPKSY
ncbi:hypothetical protein EJ02DRAFT_330857, partial [Clathrospora elynae]